MRVVAASLPAVVITLALFCLMQYLITGRARPITIPDDAGFVDLIYLKQETKESHTESGVHTFPRRPRPPAETPPLPESMAEDIGPPGLPSLSMPLPEPNSVELAGTPVLAPYRHLDIGAKPLKAEPNRAVASNIQDAIVDSSSAGGGQPANVVAPGAGEVTSGSSATGRYGNDVIPLLQIDPVYPRKAARAGTEGWVKVEFTITGRGDVVDAVVVDSRPRRIFDDSALKAIKKWQFKPRVIDGRPVQTRAAQVIEFKLARR
jgi:protein TonB